MADYAVTKERLAVGWNINSAHSKFIVSLLFRADKHHHAGQFKEQYFTLRSLRDHINHDLAITERELMDNLELAVDQKTNNLRKTVSIENRDARCTAIRKYLQNIMDALQKLGYLPKKESKTDIGL